VLAAWAAVSTAQAKEPRTKVILNGELISVTFNDGDSFRALSGNRAKARLRGYNTLESYGPVHQWGTWTPKELYRIAKMATLHARRGIWECESDGKLDTYGRMLVWCPGLAEDLVRLGMAHVMSVDDEPGDATLLAAQREAIAAKRGIWAHGVPAFILTSLHSREEDIDGHGTYNRLVSTEDAHSVKWRHETKYVECAKACNQVYSVDEAKVAEVAAVLPSNAEAAPYLTGLSQQDIESVVRDFAHYRHVNRKVAKDDREKLHAVLETYVGDGGLGEQTSEPGACMIHIDFKRRFGTGRAACLK
jgi:hypothetical protein